MIDDQDCEVDLPSPVDDHFIQDNGILVAPDAPQPTNCLLTTVRVVHCISQLIKALRASCIASSTIRLLGKRFDACMAAFPSHSQMNVTHYLDPRSLAPLIYLQNARIILHRQNLSPFCLPDVRITAIDGCVTVARDTLRILSRSTQTPPSSPTDVPTGPPNTWQSRFATAASAMLCTHIWRCVLFLCLRGEYSAALLGVRVSAAIGDGRPVNAACGRHLTCFLDCLVAKVRRGEDGDFDSDEELIAYVSGDLQSSAGNSWVWHDATAYEAPDQMGSPLPRPSELGFGNEGRKPPRTISPDEDIEDWGGWEKVEWILQRLVNDQQQRQARTSKPSLRTDDEPGSHGSTKDAVSPSVGPRSSSRISIANII